MNEERITIRVDRCHEGEWVTIEHRADAYMLDQLRPDVALDYLFHIVRNIRKKAERAIEDKINKRDKI